MGRETVLAGNGNDTVFGRLGRDNVSLGQGNDRFVDAQQAGSFGNDTSTGGAGADTFVFGTLMAADVITDFQIGTDILQLDAALDGSRDAEQFAADFATVVAGNVAFNFGAGQSITLNGLTSTVGLLDDLVLM